MQVPNEKLVALFLESDENLCLAIKRLLRLSGHTIDPVFVSDGDKALEVIHDIHAGQLPLDVFVTDYAHPPGPDGFELIRMIRNLPDDSTMRGRPGIRHVPIVMQSGNSLAGKVKDIDPDVLLVRKPYKFDDLVGSIYLAVRQSREEC